MRHELKWTDGPVQVELQPEGPQRAFYEIALYRAGMLERHFSAAELIGIAHTFEMQVLSDREAVNPLNKNH